MNKPQQQEHPKKVRISTGASHTEAVNKQDLPSPTARQKREIGPVSKFSGYPGSIECKKTVYGMKSKVFSLRDVKPEALEAKRHLVQQRMHSRLGTRKEFSTSTWLPVPQRQLSRSLSAYQTEKLDYDFRALENVDLYKKTIFIPKVSKFRVDPEIFLDPSDKGKCIHVNFSPRRELIKQRDNQQLEASRTTSVWTKDTTPNFSDLEKRELEFLSNSLQSCKKKREQLMSPGKYVTLRQRYEQSLEQIRDEKRQKKQLARSLTEVDISGFNKSGTSDSTALLETELASDGKGKL